MPPAPVGQPPPELSLAGVVVPHAARRLDMLESETAAPPDRMRKSRRVVARRLSRPLSGPSHLPVPTPAPLLAPSPGRARARPTPPRGRAQSASPDPRAAP